MRYDYEKEVSMFLLLSLFSSFFLFAKLSVESETWSMSESARKMLKT